jgi:hypothetical protein
MCNFVLMLNKVLFLLLIFGCTIQSAFAQCSFVNSILVNTCGFTTEGTDECFTIQTNGYSVDLSTLNITLPNNNVYCNSGCGTNTIQDNATYISALNTQAGCTLFEYPPSGVVPAGEQLLIFTGNTPSFTYDFSPLCPGGPIYVAFLNNFSAFGNFTNSSNANRTLTADFGNGCSDSYTYYSSSSNTGSDGDGVSFDTLGNLVSYVNDGGCALYSVLPIGLISFSVQPDQDKVLIHFEFADLTCIADLWLYRTNPSEEVVLGKFSCLDGPNFYVTDNPAPGNYFYELRAVFPDGSSELFRKIEYKKGFTDGFKVWPNPIVADQLLNIGSKPGTITRVYNSLGKLVLETSETIIPTQTLETGIYFLTNANSGEFKTCSLQVIR